MKMVHNAFELKPGMDQLKSIAADPRQVIFFPGVKWPLCAHVAPSRCFEENFSSNAQGLQTQMWVDACGALLAVTIALWFCWGVGACMTVLIRNRSVSDHTYDTGHTDNGHSWAALACHGYG